MQTFGKIIKEKRDKKKLLLREVAALLGIDQSIISKLEKGERNATREQVLKFAEIYDIEPKDLIVCWQSDKVANNLIQEAEAEEILKLAESKVKYLKTIQK